MICLFFPLFVYFSLLLLFSCPSPFVITLLEVCVHHTTNAQRCLYMYKLVCSTLANFSSIHAASMPFYTYIHNHSFLTVYKLDSTTPKKANDCNGPRIGLRFEQSPAKFSTKIHAIRPKASAFPSNSAEESGFWSVLVMVRVVFYFFFFVVARNIIYTLCHSTVLHITIFSQEKKQAATVCCCCCCCNGSTTNTNDINDIAIIIIITPFNAYCILFCGV